MQLPDRTVNNLSLNHNYKINSSNLINQANHQLLNKCPLLTIKIMFLLRIPNLFLRIKVKLQPRVTLFNSSSSSSSSNNNSNSNKQSCMETTFLNKSSINTSLAIMLLPLNNNNSNNQHHKLNINKECLLVELLLIIMETCMSREVKRERNKFQSRLIIK
jgi:hypothetical protein